MALRHGRRSVLEFYEAGRALVIIRGKLKPKQDSWTKWQAKCGLSRNRVNLATRLFEAAGGTEELERFASITDALRYYGIEKPRTEKGPPPGDDRDDDRKAPEPNGRVTIHPKAGSAVLVIEDASLFEQVSKLETVKKVLITGRWDQAATAAAARGVLVLVWREINPDWRPSKRGDR